MNTRQHDNPNGDPYFYVPEPPKALEFTEEHVRARFVAWREARKAEVVAHRKVLALAAKGLTILDRPYFEARQAEHEAGKATREAYEDWRWWANARGLPLSRDAERRQEQAHKGHR